MEIVKGIPIPRTRRTGGKYKYPWMEMEVGDSFAVDLGNVSNVQILAGRQNKRAIKGGRPERFLVASDYNRIYRCWRTA